MRTFSVPLSNLSFHPSTYNTYYHLFLVEPTIKDSIALRVAELIQALDLLATSDLSFGMWMIMRMCAVNIVAMPSGFVLCSNRSHSWHATALTHLLRNLFHRHGHTDYHSNGVLVHPVLGCPALLCLRDVPFMTAALM